MLRELLREGRMQKAVSERQAALKSMTALWDLHPQAEFFRARGGNEIPPPVACNLSLTNKCNLRCEICGSQKHLDVTGIPRRHMEIDRFEAVARTLFPTMAVVELNSQGDPLLHPQIERVLEAISEYRCELIVQTNGTLFTERVIDLLTQQVGTINISLDAVGSRFDEVRRGGVWAKAQPGLEKFLRQRNPADLWIGTYPTVTRRTLGEALTILQWAHDHDVDEVAFHKYIPINNSFEEAPSADELRELSDQVREWAMAHPETMKVTVDGNVLSPKWRNRRTSVAHQVKNQYKIATMMAPMDPAMNCADPVSICVAPDHYVEIGLDGQISACCRAQDVTLGFATSPESFAKAWFGKNYQGVRASLRRDAEGPFPIPNCEGCIANYAPNSLYGRHAVDYSADMDGAHSLDYGDWDEWAIEVIQKETGYCHIAMTPPGMVLSAYRLFEDNTVLGPGGALHDDIRETGAGQYSLWGRAVYFSTSDNSDARYNGRRYVLKRIEN